MDSEPYLQSTDTESGSDSEEKIVPHATARCNHYHKPKGVALRTWGEVVLSWIMENHDPIDGMFSFLDMLDDFDVLHQQVTTRRHTVYKGNKRNKRALLLAKLRQVSWIKQSLDDPTDLYRGRRSKKGEYRKMPILVRKSFEISGQEVEEYCLAHCFDWADPKPDERRLLAQFYMMFGRYPRHEDATSRTMAYMWFVQIGQHHASNEERKDALQEILPV